MVGPLDENAHGATFTPKEIVDIAVNRRSQGNIGIAYTYNEPLITYEFVRDCAKFAHKEGLVNAVVSNGCFSTDVEQKLRGYIDAYNIDLKCFTEEGYRKLGGDLKTVKAFIESAAEHAHVELTTLIVPGLNDEPAEINSEAKWIAGISDSIVLHLTRFYPCYHMLNAAPMHEETICKLAQEARRYLQYVEAH